MATIRFKCTNAMPGNENPQVGISYEFTAVDATDLDGVSVIGSFKVKARDKSKLTNFEVGKEYEVELSDNPASEPMKISTEPGPGEARQMGLNERGPERNAVKLEGSGAAAAAAAGGPADVKVTDDAQSDLNKK